MKTRTTNRSNSTKSHFVRTRGFLAPRRISKDSQPEEFQVICENSKRYLLDAEPLWGSLIGSLCWERVVVGGYYNAKTKTLTPLYIFKDDKHKRPFAYSESYWNEDRDLEAVNHQISVNGFFEPAA